MTSPARSNPSFFAIDATSGKVLWHAVERPLVRVHHGQRGHDVLVPDLQSGDQVRNATTGALLTSLPLPGPCWSGVAVSGGTLLAGLGTSAGGTPSGVVAFRLP